MYLNMLFKVSIFAFLSFAFFSCESAKNTQKNNSDEMITKVSMEKITRGNSSIFEITKDNVTHTSKTMDNQAGEETLHKTTAADWQKINKLVNSMNVAEIENWIAPTQERLYDGARATTITIEAVEGTYSSQSFDEGKPPAELQALYDYLESLENQ